MNLFSLLMRWGTVTFSYFSLFKPFLYRCALHTEVWTWQPCTWATCSSLTCPHEVTCGTAPVSSMQSQSLAPRSIGKVSLSVREQRETWTSKPVAGKRYHTTNHSVEARAIGPVGSVPLSAGIVDKEEQAARSDGHQTPVPPGVLDAPCSAALPGGGRGEGEEAHGAGIQHASATRRVSASPLPGARQHRVRHPQLQAEQEPRGQEPVQAALLPGVLQRLGLGSLDHCPSQVQPTVLHGGLPSYPALRLKLPQPCHRADFHQRAGCGWHPSAVLRPLQVQTHQCSHDGEERQHCL